MHINNFIKITQTLEIKNRRNCKGDTNVTGNKVQEENVFLTLTDNDYKLEYNPTKSNRS
ncbi:hypothetical protein OVS_02315 [Mycoplasma ovis str. Michigan]|uniref:Uncharacterized protein n=1 Tax=Mycoplasma ovis str. Michigan TaxID=1415773 RepID=A0ABM5P1F7_9MOLU|nr:hypothetical protein OVS_02315 [Mycoplasma ovis str. Michigan]